MIKLNLLPQYVIEVRRIRVVIIVFLVLLGLEGAIVYQAYADLQLQETWFTKDKDYFAQRADMIKAEKKTRDDLANQAKIYRPYIEFFTRNAIIEYNDKIAFSIEKAANTIGGGLPWFDVLTVTKAGDVTARGQIKGMINFLDYYWKMKDVSFTLVPQARPAPSPAQPTLQDELPIIISGKISDTFPEKPGVPGETPLQPGQLYIPAQSAQ